MGRHSCCYKQKLKKGLWSPEEDEKLVKHITRYGHGCWSSVPKIAGLQRCGKSCRLRWINYLRPDLKRGTFSQQEENLIVKLHAELGNRWSQIAAQMPGRTDNEIKNLWNSSIKKKLRLSGIDPDTHQQLADDDGREDKPPIKDETTSGSSELKILAPTSENLNARIPEPPTLLMNTVDGYLLNSSCSENSMMQTKELFPDQFIASKESSSCYQTPNSMAYFPLSQLSYTPDCNSSQAALATQSCNSNPNLWFKMNSRMLETNYGINCNSIFKNVSSASSSIPPTSMSSNPLINVSPNNPATGLQYWESGNSCSSSASSGNSGIELQNNNALLDDSIFSWSELGTDKEAQVHLAGEPEDLKWCEYLQGALRMNSTAPTQNQASYGDIKLESQYTADGSSSWPFQSSDMYGKDFQQVSAAFGHI